MVAATAVSNGKLSVKTTFVTVPADDKAFLNGAKKVQAVINMELRIFRQM